MINASQPHPTFNRIAEHLRRHVPRDVAFQVANGFKGGITVVPIKPVRQRFTIVVLDVAIQQYGTSFDQGVLVYGAIFKHRVPGAPHPEIIIALYSTEAQPLPKEDKRPPE